jgi:hypothetical protein
VGASGELLVEELQFELELRDRILAGGLGELSRQLFETAVEVLVLPVERLCFYSS